MHTLFSLIRCSLIVQVACILPVMAQNKALIPTPYLPNIAEASDEGTQAIAAFSAPEGFTMDLVAAEPLLANPVAFYFDFDGNIYVAETFRHSRGVGDMRGHRDWLVDDLASRTVEDRLIAMKKNLGAEFSVWAEEHDRISKLWDSDGDGVADQATVFADGFRDALAGIGAGLLFDRGHLYYTCIPELWRLTDTDEDGVANKRDILSSGYGVHINFLGHDLHGLRKGPDGRLYFSIGDRGVNIGLPDGSRLVEPDTGAVFRCNLDGSDLEIVHRGLRNPQELAFDNYGNLFTGDNNSDAGDQARWVWIVEGGDSGWRIGYQWVTQPNTRGPWNAEKMWAPRFDEQPAHIVPPLLNIGAGPSGLTFYPGTGMSEAYNDTFFMCDFRGDAGRSLIHALELAPSGASFEVVNRRDFANHMLATDVEFGMEPGIYFSDWVQGWDKPMKGRIYRIHEPNLANDATHAEAVQLLKEGMAQRSPEALSSLLGNADQRVRLEAQYALADLGPAALAHFDAVAQHGEGPFARLHGIWGQWQLLLQGDADATTLLPLLKDSDAEIRLQVARVLADGPADQVLAPLRDALNDPNIRVRFHAASSLGRLDVQDDGTAAALVSQLRQNDNYDAYLRHALVVGLESQATESYLAALALDPSPAVRLGGLLTLRRLKSVECARYLNDSDPSIVQEAIRAIYDRPIEGAFPALAALATRDNAPAPDDLYAWRRILGAHFRLGGDQEATALLNYATRDTVPEVARVEALRFLAQWNSPPELDPVTGAWQPMKAPRSNDVARLIAAAIPRLLSVKDPEFILATGELCDTYRLEGATPSLVALAGDSDVNASKRVAAMRLVARNNREALRPILETTLRDKADSVRAESLTHIVHLDPDAARGAIEARLATGATAEKQAAVSAIGQLAPGARESMLLELLQRLADGTLDPTVHLELLTVAQTVQSSNIATLLASVAPADAEPLQAAQPALYGGDIGNGRKIFFDKTETQCLRCHSLDGKGGSQVGPELTGLGSRVDRKHILEAIVKPNAAIAEGFENVSITLDTGEFYTGRLMEESESTLTLEVQQEADPFAEEIPHSDVDTVAESAAHGDGAFAAPNLVRMTVDKMKISERKRALSSMPEGLSNFITLSELRDLVEFLATRK